MADTINIIVNGTDNASGVLRSVSGGLDSLASTAANFGARFGATVSAPIIGLGALGIAFDASREQAEVAFTTMLGSGEEAREFLQDLADFSARTPFEFQGITQASQRLMAMGFEAEQVIPMMTAVGDAVAALGGGQFEIDRVVRALGQMQARGKTSAQEMLQLTEVGIPAWQMLADAIGTSVPEAMALVSDGAVDATTTINAVLGGMSAQFGGMMEQQSQTWNGVMSTIKDTVMMTLGTILLPLFEQAKVLLLDFANNVLPQIQAWFSALPEPVRNAGLALGIVLAAAGPLALLLAGVATAIGALLSPIGLVVAAVAGLAVAWATNFGEIREKAAQVVTFVQTALANLRAALTSSADGPAIWAQAFERAKEMVRGVMEALRSLVSAALGAIQTFIANHGAEIQAVLTAAWTQIGRIVDLAVQLIQATVIPIFRAIAQFIRDHGQEIQTVLAAAWNIIKNVIQGVLTLIEGILRAALAVLKGDWKGAWEIIKQTVSDVWENIKEILRSATELIVTVIGRALITIHDYFVEKWEGIKSYLSGINLADIGRGIIQGLIDGVRSMAGALVDAARGVVESAIQAARNLLGMHSPSLVFHAIGVGIIQGLINGIEDMTPEAVTAISEALTAAMEGVVAAMNALSGLAQLTVLDDLNERMEALSGMIRVLVAELKLLAEYFADPGSGLDSAKAVLDALKPIFDGVGAAVDAFTAMGGLSSIQTLGAGLDAFLTFLQTQIPVIVQAFATAAAAMDSEALLAAMVLAEAAIEIVAVIGPAVDAFTKFQDFNANFNYFEAGLWKLKNQIVNVVEWMIAVASGLDQEGVPAARLFAESVGLVMGAFSAAMDAFTQFQAFDAAFDYFEAGLWRLKAQIVNVVEWLVIVASGLRQEGVPAARMFAETAGLVMGALSAAMDALTKFQSFDATFNYFEAGLWRLKAQIVNLVEWLIAVAGGLDREGLTAARLFAETAGLVMGLIGQAVDAMAELAEYVRLENATQLADQLMADVVAVVQALVDGLTDDITGQLLALDAAAVALAQNVGQMVSFIKPALDAIRSLATYVRKENILAHVQAFAEDLAFVIREIVAVAMEFDNDAVAAAGQFSQAAGQVGSGIAGALAGLREIVTYVGGVTQAAVERFASDMRLLVRSLVQVGSQFDADGLAAATEFSQAAGAIGGAISSTITGLKAIMEYAGGLTAEMVDVFMIDVELLVWGVAMAASRISTSAVASARALAEAAQVVGDGIVSMAEAMLALADYSAPAPEKFDEFAADVYTIIEKLRIVAAVLGDEAIQSALQFAEAGAAIYQAIEDGVNSVAGLSKNGQLGGIPAAMAELVQAIVNATVDMTAAWVILVGKAFVFGRDWVQAIIDGMNSRLGDLEALLAYIRGLFPSSPAQYGPWRTLPDGAGVGSGFALGLAGGVGDGQGAVVSALYDLRQAFSGNGAAGRLGGGLVVHQTINVGNGDPALVRDAARLGLMEAARSLGVA